MEKLISIIVPVYNKEPFLEKCINSLINQSYKKIEIILIDDGSSDNSLKICKNYTKIDERITVYHKQNSGLGNTRNYGIERATGDYILFVDSDDYVNEDYVEKLYSSAVEHDADICYCDFNRVKNDVIISNNHIKGLEGFYCGEELKQYVIPNIVGGSPYDATDDIIGWSVCKCLIKKSVIGECRFHSEKEMISEDIIFQLDIYKNIKRVSIIGDCLYNYLVNDNSLSRTYRSDRFDKIKYLYEQQLKRIEELGCIESTKIRADRMLISNIRMEMMIDVLNLSKKEFIELLNIITDDSLISGVLNKYPIKHLPFKQKIFASLLKKKKYYMLYFLVKMYMKTKYKER